MAFRYAASLGLAAFVLASGANAQATRTWVSGVGDDANPCSRTAPCKTFAGAISKTAAKGEINVLDPGAFGGVTITKSISIIAEDVEAGVIVSGTNGIIINAGATDNVTLKGLDIEGLTNGTSLSGVKILNAAAVDLRDLDIRGFTSATSAGVDVQTPSSTRVYLDNVRITNSTVGILVKPSAANPNRAFVDASKFVQNTATGIKVDGAQSLVVLSDSYLANPVSDITVLNSGVVTSYGDNVIRLGNPTSASTYE